MKRNHSPVLKSLKCALKSSQNKYSTNLNYSSDIFSSNGENNN